MTKQKSGPPAMPDDVGVVMGWFKDFFRQFQLAWRLILDPRVSLLAKLIPLLSVIYLISPWDFIPDFVLGLGQLDDLALFLIGLRLFIDVCPPILVQEHRNILESEYRGEAWAPDDEDVIDIEVLRPDDEEEAA